MSDTKKKNPKSDAEPPASDPDDGGDGPYDSLIRDDDNQGMRPVSLLTGLYGSRGERIRHTAHLGALQLPESALTIMTPPPAASTERAASRRLPTLDSVQRPSTERRGNDDDDLIVTTVTLRMIPQHDPVTGDVTDHTARTAAENHAEPRRIGTGENDEDERGEEEKREEGDDDDDDEDPQRIRGGVGEDTPQQQQDGDGDRPVVSGPGGMPPPRGMAPPPAAYAPPPPDPLPRQQQMTMTTTSTGVPNPVATTAVPDPVPTDPTPPVATDVPVATGDHGDTPSATHPPATTAGASTATTTTSPPVAATPSTTAAAAPPSAAPAPPSTPAAAAEDKKEAPETKSEEPSPVVVIRGLDKTPSTQWEQHRPGPADEMAPDPAGKTVKPDWFVDDAVSDVERASLPEWFDGSARHRTAASYLRARNRVVHMSDALGTKFVTATLVRRSVPGDAGSLLRLHEFLTAYALINEDATNDSAPTPQALLGGESVTAPLYWNKRKDDRLMECVVEQARRKRPRLAAVDDDGTSDAVPPSLDWDVVAERVGMTASQCEQRFLTLPVQPQQRQQEEDPAAGSVTPDNVNAPSDDGSKRREVVGQVPETSTTAETVRDLVSRADPAVVRSVLHAAWEQTSRPDEARNAAVAGLALRETGRRARSDQDASARLVSHAVDLRMRKLEHRLALLDDVEGLLEAERVALELERRDLYTARCRHWFGGA